MKKPNIVNIEKIIPDAYHGTSAKNAKNICQEGFRPSEGEQYLGDGVYFYEAAMSHAENWARKQFKGEPIGVLKSTINLGRCLDLHVKEHQELANFVAEKLRKRGKWAITDAVVINFIASNFLPIDSVKATYVSSKTTKRVFDGSRFYSHSRLIICVRNLKNILKVSLVCTSL
ncbi:MAG TPA: hypothetical protein VJ879_09585 [Desulfobacter sp.]|nr:hypothetical protein [Desulfobacter sp.]